MTFSEASIFVAMTVFLFVLISVVRKQLLKLDQERNGLPWRHVPHRAFLPTFLYATATGVFFFLLIIGLSQLPT